MKAVIKSKKFWMTLIAVAVPIVNKLFGFDFNTEEIATVMAPMVGYIVGQGIADINKGRNYGG